MNPRLLRKRLGVEPLIFAPDSQKQSEPSQESTDIPSTSENAEVQRDESAAAAAPTAPAIGSPVPPSPSQAPNEETIHQAAPPAPAVEPRAPRLSNPRREPVPPTPERHSRKCRVCAHPERDDIDNYFLHWHSPENLALQFSLPIDSIYRHAHSTGLFARRAGKLRHALEFIIEHAQRCTPSADAIIRAVRAYTCINDDGKWVEPTKHVVFTTQHQQIPPSSPPEPAESGDESGVSSSDASYLASDPYPSPSPENDESLAPSHSPRAPASNTTRRDDFLIANSAIRNSTQLAENTDLSKILIANSPADSSPAKNSPKSLAPQGTIGGAKIDPGAREG